MKDQKNISNYFIQGILNQVRSSSPFYARLLKSGGKVSKGHQQKPKIHIKKSNEGKFTSYCGGQVTDSCIAKAKASGNSTLIKRAVFAQNTRKWKHKEGGRINVHSTSRIPGVIDSNSELDNMKTDYVSKKKRKKVNKKQYGGEFEMENRLYNVLHKNRVPDSVIHGIIANGYMESKLNPDAKTSKYSGLFQFSPSQAKYVKEKYGWTPEGQVQYIADYYNVKLPKNSFGYLSNKLHNSTLTSDAGGAAAAFYKYFERGSANNSEERRALAERYADLFRENSSNNIEM